MKKTEGRKYHDNVPLKMIQLRDFDTGMPDYPASRQSGTGLKKTNDAGAVPVPD
jgi:hypothetical protein